MEYCGGLAKKDNLCVEVEEHPLSQQILFLFLYSYRNSTDSECAGCWGWRCISEGWVAHGTNSGSPAWWGPETQGGPAGLLRGTWEASGQLVLGRRDCPAWQSSSEPRVLQRALSQAGRRALRACCWAGRVARRSHGAVAGGGFEAGGAPSPQHAPGTPASLS